MPTLPPIAPSASAPNGAPPASGSAAAAAGPDDPAGGFLALLPAEAGVGTTPPPVRPGLSPDPADTPQAAANGIGIGDSALADDAPAAAVADPAALGLLADLAALFLPQAVTTPPPAPPTASGGFGTVGPASSAMAPASGATFSVAAPDSITVPACGEDGPASASPPSDAVISQPLPIGFAEAAGAKSASASEFAAGTRAPSPSEARRAPRSTPAASPTPAAPSSGLSGEQPASIGIAPIQAEAATPVSASASSTEEDRSGGERERQDREKPTAPTSGFALPAGVTMAAAESRPASAMAPPGLSAAAGNPVQQVAPVVIALAHAPQHGGRVTVTLQPEQLGRVEIHLRQQPEAGASVHLVAERPETLALLQRDAGQLDRALGQAGITLLQGGLSFALAGGDGGGDRSGGQRSGGRGRTGGDWLEGEGALGSLDATPRRLVLSLLDIAV